MIEDPSNNTVPTRLIQKWTKYVKVGKKQNIQNYQVSHIFGKTKNPYLFTAPFNIMFLPKILDPFTGHESRGDISSNFKKAIQDFAYQKFSTLIEDYNEMISAPEFQDKLLKAIDEVASSSVYDKKDSKMDKFKSDALSEFKPISKI